MDRSKQLSRWCPRWSRVAIAALLIAGCEVGIQDGSPPHIDATVAPAVSLEDGIEMLSVADAEILRDGMFRSHRTVEALADLPSGAISAGFFGAGEFDDPPVRPAELVVVNYWPTHLRMNVICLVDGVQVPCSQDAAVWRVEIDEPSLAIVDLPETDARRDVVVAEERDHLAERVYPVSRVRPIDGWDVPFSDLGDPPPAITNPFGGCDWALLLDDLEPRATLKPLRAKGVGAVYLVVSICPDNASHEMLPLVLLDETTVAETEEFRPFVAQPGATYALQIPEELFETAHTIRGAVVRRAPGSGHWVTHPLFAASGPAGG